MQPRIVLAYKNFAANRNVSHIGLGVAAINTSKTLIASKVGPVEVWPLTDANNLRQKLNLARSSGVIYTHVVVSAPWITTAGWQQITNLFPETQFGMVCHSNTGFLQADSNGVKLLREDLDLEQGLHNFRVAGNSQKFCTWVERAYGRPCAYLPNLYYIDGRLQPPNRPLWRGGTLRIGAFGATRPLKNFVSAVGAAIEIGTTLKTDTEIWVSSGRTEGGGDTILRAARELVVGLPHVKLIESGWRSWPKFRELVGSMHLLLQPSYTESFNMVTADGISQGVPSVVSDAIDWVPKTWVADADDVDHIAYVGRALLNDPYASSEGSRALQRHNDGGVRAWMEFLQ